MTGSISGTVFYKGAEKGPVYLLLLPVNNKKMLRTIQSQSLPFQSEYVSQYIYLDAPGNYQFTKIDAGDYVLWSWLDVNQNGSVDYFNFTEPTGWFQTDKQLTLATITVEAGKEKKGINLKLISPIPYSDEDKKITIGKGGGTLKTLKGNKVLHLWGLPKERGYAYGYLVGQQIVDWIEYVLVENFVGSVKNYEEIALPYIKKHFNNQRYFTEIDAMIKGMKDAGVDTFIGLLDRDITRLDIEAQNCYWLLWEMALYGFFKMSSSQLSSGSCSGVAFWGEWTRNAELNGGLVHGKNMDGENDLRKVTVNDLLLIAVEPPQESGLNKYVGVDWPGSFGTFNAMNEHGLILTPHCASSVPSWEANEIIAYPVLYREALQKGRTINDVQAIWKSLACSAGFCGTGGFNTGIYTPYMKENDSFPAVIYETDAYGGAIRYPGEIPPKDLFCILVTNTFYKYTGVYPKAFSDFLELGPFSGITSKSYRYIDMLDTVIKFKNEGKTVGTQEIIQLLQVASTSKAYSGKTEYSYIAYPNKMSFALAKEDLARRIMDAPFAKFTNYTFEEAFH